MSEAAFTTSVLGWHDFYLAAAGASAALLGLLFVGVSINLAAITGKERVDLRAKAGLAFTNLVYVLSISLIMLIANPAPQGLGLPIGAIAALGLVRVASRLIAVLRAHGIKGQRGTFRRMGWTVVADLVLGYVAVSLLTSGDARVIVFVTASMFILLIGAADVAWEMLVQVSEETEV